MDADASERGTRPVDYVWAVARISIARIFLWAFLDKTFGWGFATPASRAWLSGGSPTTGFLKGAGENALGGFFFVGLALAGAGTTLGLGNLPSSSAART